MKLGIKIYPMCLLGRLLDSAVGIIEGGRIPPYEVIDTFEPPRDSKSTAPRGNFTLPSPIVMIRSCIQHIKYHDIPSFCTTPFFR
jgi:hypothetical protein